MCIWCLWHTPSFNTVWAQSAPVSQGFTYYGLEVFTSWNSFSKREYIPDDVQEEGEFNTIVNNIISASPYLITLKFYFN